MAFADKVFKWMPWLRYSTSDPSPVNGDAVEGRCDSEGRMLVRATLEGDAVELQQNATLTAREQLTWNHDADGTYCVIDSVKSSNWGDVTGKTFRIKRGWSGAAYVENENHTYAAGTLDALVTEINGLFDTVVAVKVTTLAGDSFLRLRDTAAIELAVPDAATASALHVGNCARNRSDGATSPVTFIDAPFTFDEVNRKDFFSLPFTIPEGANSVSLLATIDWRNPFYTPGDIPLAMRVAFVYAWSNGTEGESFLGLSDVARVPRVEPGSEARAALSLPGAAATRISDGALGGRQLIQYDESIGVWEMDSFGATFRQRVTLAGDDGGGIRVPPGMTKLRVGVVGLPPESGMPEADGFASYPSVQIVAAAAAR